jgi:N-acetyl-gamma-glutamyl-phosphate/LysW-gamma-L-alpha-aminoadipyl-6-phosphate reductase
MVHPNLRGVSEQKFSSPDSKALIDECEVVFLATPHGVSKNIVPDLLENGLKIIDLSADFRLKNPDDYPKWYGWKHPHPEFLETAVFGLPELHRDKIRSADLVACGGCMATATILGLAPILKAGLVETDRIVVDVKIGSSGGGSEPTLAAHHPERFGGLRPYNVVGHRHTAEIEQELSFFSNNEVKIAFTPHAVNMARGILSTSHLWLSSPMKNRDIWRAYRNYYEEEPFIHLVKYRKGLYQLPDPKVVTGTNYCEIGFEIDPHINRLVVLSAIDNIVKGAAGQAVHCFNIMFSFDEIKGLDLIGIH